MSKKIKVIIIIMALAIVGLGAGLVVSLMGNKVEPTRPDIEAIEVLPDDNNLNDITVDGAEVSQYSINLNVASKFKLKYIAKPLDLNEYAIIVKSSSNAISVVTDQNLNNTQTASVEFVVNRVPEDGLPITITFEAVSIKDSSESKGVVGKVFILVTKPSTLKGVQNIRYENSSLVWDAVNGNTENIPVESSTIQYRVELTYKVGKEDKRVSIDTLPGVTSFALADKLGGFELGTINSAKVTALGDNINTSNSVASDEYKFYILKNPSCSFNNKVLTVSDMDAKAGALVVKKYVEDTYKQFNYIQNDDDTITFDLSRIEGTDATYDIELLSTIAKTHPEYDVTKYNSKLNDGVHYFDSPKQDNITVTTLMSTSVSLDNSNKSSLTIKSGVVIDSYSPTRVCWESVTNDPKFLEYVYYLVTISNGSNSYEYVVKETYFDITKDVLQNVRDAGGYDTYEVCVSAFAKMSNDDKGNVPNDVRDNMLILDAVDNLSSKATIKDYWDYSNTDLALNIVDTMLSYKLPTPNASIKVVDELQLIFVSKTNEVEIIEVSDSGEIDLSNIVDVRGEYDLYVVAKGVNGALNNQYVFTNNSIYKSIGAPVNLNLSVEGVLTYTAVNDASSYEISIQIGDNVYTTTTTGTSLNIIDLLNERDGYSNVLANIDDEYYQISVKSVSSTSGWCGATSSINFGKLDTISTLPSSLNSIDLQGNIISWGASLEAIAYELTVNSASIVIDNAETSLKYVGTNIENALEVGSNLISIYAKGVVVDGVTYLKSNIKSQAFDKLASPINLSIKDNELYFDGSNAGKYNIIIKVDDALKYNLSQTSVGSEENKYNLSQITIEENATYSISINRSYEGYFSSDYSIIFVKKIPSRELAVVKYSGENYIAWEDLVESSYEGLEAIEYSSNSNTDLQIYELGSFVGVKLSEVSLKCSITNEYSLGLQSVGNYVFNLYLNTTKNYTTTSVDSPAYISSNVATVNIKRLSSPTFSVSGYNITLSASDISGMLGYNLSIVNKSDSSYVVENTPISSTSSFDTRTITLNPGLVYEVQGFAKGNISETIAQGVTTYVLDSAVAVKDIYKLNPVTLSLIENNGTNVITFSHTNDNPTSLNYLVYAKESTSHSPILLVEDRDYDIEVTETSVIITSKLSTNQIYSVKIAKDDSSSMGYITSTDSNDVKIINTNLSRDLSFVGEDKLSWSDPASVSEISKYYLTILQNTNIVALYEVIINGIDRTAVITQSTTTNETITNEFVKGIKYNEGTYIIDISYLKHQGYITPNNDYTAELIVLGAIDTTPIPSAYNNNASLSSINFTYHKAYSASINAFDTLTIPTNILASDYSTLILEVISQSDVRDKYVFSLNDIVGNYEVRSNLGTSIVITKQSNAITLDFSNYEAGTYNLTIKSNKEGRLGVVSEESQKYSFTKLQTFATEEERVTILNGKIYIEKPSPTRSYKVFVNDTQTPYVYQTTSNVDRITIDYSSWVEVGVFDYAFNIVISEEGKLISNVSQTYNINLLSTSVIDVELEYVNTYDISNYVVTWTASNVKVDNGNIVDLASGYVIELQNGDVISSISVVANQNIVPTDPLGAYSIEYINGKYILKINHNAYPTTIDLTKTTTISLVEVVGEGDSISALSPSNVYNVSNTAKSSKQVNYLIANNILSIVDGMIVVASNAKASEAILIITKNDGDVVYKKEYTKDLAILGDTINLKNINLSANVSDTFNIEFRYIGNNTNIVTSASNKLIAVARTIKPSIDIVDGKLYITGALSGSTYNYVIKDSNEEVLISDIVTYTSQTGVYEINTSTLPSGTSTIVMTALTLNQIISEEVVLSVYKYNPITNLQQSITTTGTQSQKVNLILSYTSENIISNSDIVANYKLIFTSNIYENTKLEYLSSEIESKTYINGQWNITITNLSEIITTLGNEFTVSIVELGDTQYLQNLYVSDVDKGNTITVVKVSSATSSAIKISSKGLLEIGQYVYPNGVNNSSYVVNTASLRFEKGEDLYTLTVEGLDLLSAGQVTEIDLTTTQVYNGSTWVYLPSGTYIVYLAYISSTPNVIYGDEVAYSGIIKTSEIDSISILSSNLYSVTFDEDFEEGEVYYNYLITKPDQTDAIEINNYESNIIEHLNNANYPSGKYKIQIQKVVCGKTLNGKTAGAELKSQFSQVFTYTKLSKIDNFSAQVVDDGEYNIVLTYSIPQSNFDTTDIASSYTLTMYDITNPSKLLREYVYNSASNYENSLYDKYGNSNSKISLTYDNDTATYTITIPITRNLLLDSIDSETASLASNNIGKYNIQGIGDKISKLVFSIDQISGSKDKLYVSVDTIGSTTTYVEQLQSNNINVEVSSGLLTVSGADLRASQNIVYLYKEVSDGVYSIDPNYIYEWDITQPFKLYEAIDSGYYLVVVASIGDESQNIIDASLSYANIDVARRIRVLDTPTLTIIDGVLNWTSVKEVDENITYVLTIKSPTGEVSTVTVEDQLSYNMNGKEYEAGKYEITIKALSYGCIRSKDSLKFEATKLNSPNVQIVREYRVLKLKWLGVENATSYSIYDYSVKDKTYAITPIDIDSFDMDIYNSQGIYSYEFDLNNDVSLGEHKYYVVSHGTESTIEVLGADIVYVGAGHLNSYGSEENENVDQVATIEAITNTTSNIYMRDGVMRWDTINGVVDYYNIYIDAKFSSGSIVSHTMSLNHNSLDTSTITYQDITTSDYLDITIENVVTTAKYMVVSTTIDRPLTNIKIFNMQKALENVDYSISQGMLKYNVSISKINEFVRLINANKEATTSELNFAVGDLFTTNNEIIRSFIEPIININGVDYEIGRDTSNDYLNIDEYYVALYGGVPYLANYSDLISGDAIVNDNVTSVELYIPLPSSLDYGTYNITFRSKGNSTSVTSEIAVARSRKSEMIEGFKLDSPNNIFVTNVSYEMRDGVLKFTPTPTKNTNAYVQEYTLLFVAVDKSGERVIKQSTITLTHVKSKLYTNSYSAYIDLTNNIVEVDIYRLYVLDKFDSNNTLTQEEINLNTIKDGLYNEEFTPLQADIHYHISISAMGGKVVVPHGTDVDMDTEYVNYFNSNLSRLGKTFKVLSAPDIYIDNDAINWQINADVVSYTIYFFDSQTREFDKENAVYFENLTKEDIDKFASTYVYSNIQDNPDLPAGIYNVMVESVGNGDEKLTSRLSDCEDFITQKLEAVTVEVKNGMYMWKNSSYCVVGNALTDIGEEQIYLRYVIEVYHNGEYNALVDRETIVAPYGEFTTWELPERYLSRDAKGLVDYSIRVYTNTAIEGNNWLLPSDSNVGYSEQLNRHRSDSISGNFTITKDGNIKFEDIYKDNNNYIVFIYIDGNDVLEFTSKPIDRTEFNIYSLEDVNGNTFEAKAGTYYIKVKSIDKTNFTDTFDEDNINLQDAILRSVFTSKFTIQLIAKPNFEITQGDINWDTNYDSLHQEHARSRVIIEGLFMVDGEINNIPLWLEYSETDITIKDLKLKDFKVKAVKAEGMVSTIDHYYYAPDMKVDVGETLNNIKLIEGNNYTITIRFIGDENKVVTFNNDEAYLISSMSFVRDVYLISNPKAPFNPKLLESDNQIIFNNIPSESLYKNYIYWDLANDSSVANANKIQDYDVMILLRKFEVDGSGNKKFVDYKLAYEYILRGLNGEYSVSLVDYMLKDVNRENVTNKNYVSVVDLNSDLKLDGVYLSIDEMLLRISKVSGIDFAEWDICIYVEAVGSTVTYSENAGRYQVTYHYDYDTMLEISDSNPYVLAITIPAVPTGFNYDGEGGVTWDAINDSNIYNELIVAYEYRAGKTIENVNYSNIDRNILVVGSDGRITVDGVVKSGDELIELKTMLGITHLTDDKIFADSDKALFKYNRTYYIDTITMEPNQGSYKLKYVTSNIRLFALRAVSIMTTEGDDEFLDEFVSNPYVITVLDKSNINFAFTIFVGGDGSKSSPFLLNNIIDLKPYIEEYSYFELVTIDDNNPDTPNMPENITLSNTSSKLLISTKMTFNGVLDCKGATYTINYDYVTFDNANYISALFYDIGKSAMVMNLNIVYVSQPSSSVKDTTIYLSSVAYMNHGVIANVDVSGDITGRTNGGKAYIAGIALYNYGSVYYCDVTSDISVSDNIKDISYVAGIVYVNGINTSKHNYTNSAENGYIGKTHNIEASSYSGKLTGHNIGGIVYTMYSGYINYCSNHGSIVYLNNITNNQGAYHNIGGLIGYLNNTVTSSSAGNIININNSFVEIQSINISITKKYDIYMGGLIGYNGAVEDGGRGVVDIDTAYANIDKSITQSNTTNAQVRVGSIAGRGGSNIEYNAVYYHYDNNFNKIFGDTDNASVNNLVNGYDGTNYPNYSESIYYNGSTVYESFNDLLDGYMFNTQNKLIELII